MGKLIGLIILVVVVGMGVMYWQNSKEDAATPEEKIQQSASEMVESTKQLIDQVADETATKIEEATAPAAEESAAPAEAEGTDVEEAEAPSEEPVEDVQE